MKKEITDLKKLDLFNYYNMRDNPFVSVTTKIDITNLYKLGKKTGSCYGTIGYYVALAMNEVNEFKYRYEDGKIYEYDKIIPSFTQLRNDKNIGFFNCPMIDNYDEFINIYIKTNEEFLKDDDNFQNSRNDVVWYSCTPWFNFSGINVPFDKEITIPQVIWDKFTLENNCCYVNMMVMGHHGFIDGYHIGLFLEKLNKLIKEIKI